MVDILLSELERTFHKCSDCLLHPEYISHLDKLISAALSKDQIDFLCDKVISKKLVWEIRFVHLCVLLLNSSTTNFDLKDFYLESIRKCRRLAMRIFLIRGYATYASEEELKPIMEKFQKSLEKNHDYIDYNYILSVAGLPYLVNTYGYDCFVKSLEKAQEEHAQIDPLLQGYFTLNKNLEQVDILTIDEIRKRSELFLEKCRNKY